MSHARMPEPAATPALSKVALWVAAVLAVFAALLFLPAGRVDWPAAWIYLGIVLAVVVANFGGPYAKRHDRTSVD